MGSIKQKNKSAKKGHRALIVDDNELVIRSIENFYNNNKDRYRVIRPTFEKHTGDAVEAAEEEWFDIICVDYEIEKIKESDGTIIKDGIALLKYLFTNTDDRYPITETCYPFGIVYSGSTESELAIANKEGYEWCISKGVKFMEKAKDHSKLFDTFCSLTQTNSNESDHLNFEAMTSKELLLTLAQPLIAELQKNADDVSFLGSKALKGSDIVGEIISLSPLGKEIIYNFIEAEREYLNLLKDENKPS